ncbi:DUF4253 domain-containing protein [Actinomadura fibrosa]|uniref:DUF4253 domain-containing protein n=1 Tax=Actinomadura fibrosa TaxID=111802 RepID=A0ABW2XYM0_9ACTN|nr:DUF4253 domain-containing protein [Actinomadura fibrosa]
MRCLAERDATGLYPILFSWPSVEGGAWSLEGVAATDLNTELEQAWRAERARFRQYDERFPGGDHTDLLPAFTEWPGLAPAVPATAASPGPDEAAAAVVRCLLKKPCGLDDCHLVLAPAERSADVPVVIGWHAETSLDLLCALLRSWEDRFGARVVVLQGAQMWVSVARPPATAEHAAHIALEHFLTDTDTMREFTPFADYAAGLIGAHVWQFWWD